MIQFADSAINISFQYEKYWVNFQYPYLHHLQQYALIYPVKTSGTTDGKMN